MELQEYQCDSRMMIYGLHKNRLQNFMIPLNKILANILREFIMMENWI